MSNANSEQLLNVYDQHVKNLREPDSSGIDEILVLVTRSSLGNFDWTSEQQAQIDRLDKQLASHWRIFRGTLPHPAEHPREQWWWFLHEGPQVLEEARRISA